MSSSDSAKGRKSSRKKAASAAGKKKPRSKPVSRKPAGARKKATRWRRPLVLPLVSIWLLAVIALAGLIYWGREPGGRQVKRAVSVSTSRKAISKGVGRSRPARPEKPKSALPSVSSSRPVVESGPKVIAKADRTPPTYRPPPPPKPAPLGRVAIVIDDFGMDLKVAEKFLELPIPITFSVIPYLRHSRQVGELVRKRGHEVMLHMPMQPQGYPQENPGQGALMVTMGPRQIRKALDRALRVSPYAEGVNNHMGSRFTEDPVRMKIVLEELRKRHLFFLDSFTTAHSVGYRLARQMEIPSLRRDIFLDHQPTAQFITAQLHKLIQKAKIRGSAVAIGHPYPVTLETLKKNIDLFSRERIEVVGLSQLMPRQNHPGR